MTKKEQARERALEKKARTTELPDGKSADAAGHGQAALLLDQAQPRRLDQPLLGGEVHRAGTGKVREKSLGLVDLSTLEEARKRVLDEIAKPLHEGVDDPVAKAKEARKAAEVAAKGLPTFARCSRPSSWRTGRRGPMPSPCASGRTR